MSASKVKAIPEGYRTVTPYLVVPDAAGQIEFLEKAFAARATLKMMNPDGSVGHAEIRVGDSILMIGQARERVKAMPACLYLYVEDADAAFQKAVAAGATVLSPVKDQFYGDRSGGVTDAYGNQWWIATHIEDMPEEELTRRAAAARGGQ